MSAQQHQQLRRQAFTHDQARAEASNDLRRVMHDYFDKPDTARSQICAFGAVNGMDLLHFQLLENTATFGQPRQGAIATPVDVIASLQALAKTAQASQQSQAELEDFDQQMADQIEAYEHQHQEDLEQGD